MKAKKPYHHGALRQTLITEALRALEKDGLDGLSLRRLAARTGVSKTAPYRHFADKRDLLVALSAEGFRQLADALQAALEASDHSTTARPTDGILSLFRAYLSFACSHPALYGLMLSRLGFSLHSESCRINSERALGYLVQAVEGAQASGWRAAKHTMSLVLSLWAEVHGWAGLLIDDLVPPQAGDEAKDPARMTEALLD